MTNTKILVIDDEPNIRRMMEMIHRNVGWEAQQCGQHERATQHERGALPAGVRPAVGDGHGELGGVGKQSAWFLNGEGRSTGRQAWVEAG